MQAFLGAALLVFFSVPLQTRSSRFDNINSQGLEATPPKLTSVNPGHLLEPEVGADDLDIVPLDPDDFIAPPSPPAPITTPMRFNDMATQTGEEEEEAGKPKVPSHSQEWSDHMEHVHPHVCVLFCFVALTMGCVTQYVLSRSGSSLPYTCVLLVEGFLIGLLHYETRHGLGVLSESISLWAHIDPHVLLFVFLPALIFAETMTINWHLFKKCFWQCLTIAFPGVIFGSVVIATVSRWILPYHWDWPLAIAFGALISATDTVAVLGILKSLGASRVVTMLIAGESFLNDGTAMVVFNLAQAFHVRSDALLRDAGLTPDHHPLVAIIWYFLRMSIGGPIVGGIIGYGCVKAVKLANKKVEHHDTIVQITVTVNCAYLSFFISEYIVGVSGVLAVVAAAIVVGTYASQNFTEPETMAHVWHAIEFIGNTVIFILAGLIMANVFCTRSWVVVGHEGVLSYTKDHIVAWDFVYLLELYVVMVATRFLMIGFFSPILTRTGLGLSWKNAVVVSWGGLRGAVGLALAMGLDHNLGDDRNGSRVMFFASGLATLTMLINGVLSRPLLNMLGMTRRAEVEKTVLENISKHIKQHAMDQFEKQVVNRWSSESKINSEQQLRDRVFTICSSFAAPTEENDAGVGSGLRGEDLAAVRSIFLSALSSAYQDQVEMGLLAHHRRVHIALTESVDLAIDRIEQGLTDAEVVLSYCTPEAQNSMFNTVGDKTAVCYMLQSFIEGHRSARANISQYLGEEEGELGNIVLKESDAEVATIKRALKGMSEDVLQEVNAQQIASTVLEHQRTFINKLATRGVLNDKQVHELSHRLGDDIAQLHSGSRGSTDRNFRDRSNSTRW